MFPGLISNFKAFKLLRQNLGHISTVNKHCETASLNCNQAEVCKYTRLSQQHRTPLSCDFKQLNSYCTIDCVRKLLWRCYRAKRETLVNINPFFVFLNACEKVLRSVHLHKKVGYSEKSGDIGIQTKPSYLPQTLFWKHGSLISGVLWYTSHHANALKLLFWNKPMPTKCRLTMSGRNVYSCSE